MFNTLKQGQDFLKNEKTIEENVTPHLKLIAETSSPELKSLIEGMSNKNITHKNSDKLDGLQNKFNKTLKEYYETYQRFSEDLLKRSQSKQKVSNYLGKVINYSNDSDVYYYVNNYGYTHKYSNSAWKNNDSSCETSSTTFEGETSSLQSGPVMGSGQPCGVAGSNIKNKSTGEYAWVDIKGYKHVYENNNLKTCLQKNTIELEESLYDAIPTGSNMKDVTDCTTLDVNPGTYTKLIKLNKEVKMYAKKMLTEVNKMSDKDEEIQNEINRKKSELQNYLNTINDNSSNMLLTRHSLPTVHGENEDSQLNMTSNYYKYLLTHIILAVIIAATIRAYYGGDIGLLPLIIIGFIIFGLLLSIFR
jgi:hypothetical protein